MKHTPKKLDRPMRLTERVLLLGAVALLSWAAFSLAEARTAQAYGEWSLERMRHGLAVSRIDYVVERVVPSLFTGSPESSVAGAARNGESSKASLIAPGGLVGRIEIPRLHVRAIVLEGDTDETLRRGVGHISGTPMPGQTGNSALAGHRDTFFHPLIRIRRSDRISFVTPEKTYRYSVDSVRIVSPDDVAVLDSTSSSILTLVTCYPFNYIGAAPSRFVVRAHRLDPL